MENIRTPLNFGSIAGICSFAIFLLLYLTGYNPLGNLSWTAAWVPIVFIILGIKKHRDDNLNGFMSYGQALGIGCMIAIVFASFYGILVYIFGVLIDPGIVELSKREAMESMEKASEQLPQIFGEEMYDKMLEQIDEISISSISLSEFTNKLIWGILISLISAAFLKKNKSPLEETADE